MKTLLMNTYALFRILPKHLLMILSIPGLWLALPKLIGHFEPTAGLLDSSIVQIILLALTCYFLLITLCWWFLNQFWNVVGLPQTKDMVLQFQTLMTWQQLGFYWASFALLLLVGVGCLAAVL